MNLLIDDERNGYADLIARNFLAGMTALKHIQVDTLFLDHDLGETERVLVDNIWYYPTGEGILKWLSLHELFYPTKVKLVTSNPVGKKAMEQMLIDMHYQVSIEGYWIRWS